MLYGLSFPATYARAFLLYIGACCGVTSPVRRMNGEGGYVRLIFSTSTLSCMKSVALWLNFSAFSVVR